jgi:hypothetical protein
LIHTIGAHFTALHITGLRTFCARRPLDALTMLGPFNPLRSLGAGDALRTVHLLGRGAALLAGGLARSAPVVRLGALCATVAFDGLAVLAAMIARPGSGRR